MARPTIMVPPKLGLEIMQEIKVSQEELSQLYQELVEQAQGVRSKWRKALRTYQPSEGRADLVRYIKFVIRAVGQSAQLFAETMQESNASGAQLQALWESAQQSRQSLSVLSAQCDDFVRQHKPAAPQPTNHPVTDDATLAQVQRMRRAAQRLAKQQTYQRAVITTALGMHEVCDDKLVTQALHAMAGSLELEQLSLRRRRKALRAVASTPITDLPAIQKRVSEWDTKLRTLATHMENRERYLAHLITWH